jgi:hypothetical protein
LALEGVGKNWEKSVFGKLLLASLRTLRRSRCPARAPCPHGPRPPPRARPDPPPQRPAHATSGPGIGGPGVAWPQWHRDYSVTVARTSMRRPRVGYCKPEDLLFHLQAGRPGPRHSESGSGWSRPVGGPGPAQPAQSWVPRGWASGCQGSLIRTIRFRSSDPKPESMWFHDLKKK